MALGNSFDVFKVSTSKSFGAVQVSFLFTYPCRTRNEYAHDFLSSTGPPNSLSKDWFLRNTIPFAAATTMEELSDCISSSSP